MDEARCPAALGRHPIVVSSETVARNWSIGCAQKVETKELDSDAHKNYVRANDGEWVVE